jgi:hypothetical protein
LKADHHEPAVGGKHVDVAAQVAGAHVVEHDVRSTAAGGISRRGHEVVVAVVDRKVGTELAAALELGR